MWLADNLNLNNFFQTTLQSARTYSSKCIGGKGDLLFFFSRLQKINHSIVNNKLLWITLEKLYVGNLALMKNY